MEKIFIEIAIFIFGTSIGSFLNVLIDRLPKEESINGRSHCDYCRRHLRWFELIPVVSFFIQGGRSHCCQKKISWRYPTVELLTGFMFVLILNFKFQIFNQFRISNYQLLITLALISCLIVIFFTDLKYQIIPDSMQIALFIFSLLFYLPMFVYVGCQDPNWNCSYVKIMSFLFLLFYGAIIMLPILLLYLITRGRGMGFGDVKLAFSLGFLLGIKSGLIALYLAFITGAIVGLVLIIFKKKKLKSKVAFGPFLVIGTIIMLFWGEKILELIKKKYGL